MNVLVTGGAGYIGSHACVQLLEAGHFVVVLDNFSNGFPEAVDAVAEIVGNRPVLIQGDIADRDSVESLLREHAIDAVMHFAGLKSVGESLVNPMAYYETNLVGTLRLVQAMDAADVRTLVFSSSATVYGEPERTPVDETCRLGATNPYGRTKLQIEDMLRRR